MAEMKNPGWWANLKVDCVEVTDDGWPGWVKVRLIDAYGVSRLFPGKIPMFFADDHPDVDATPGAFPH